MHKEEIFAELLQRLADLGIEPTHALDKLPAVVELREWSPAVTSSQDDEDDDIEVLEALTIADKEQALSL
jgi:hypothetical protein